MRENPLRSQIVTGGFTLPVTLVLAALMWVAEADKAHNELLWWGGLAATAVVGFSLVELNNRNALLRIRSRMVASTFFLLSGAITFMHSLDASFLPAFCLVAAYYVLFFAYQNFRAQGYVFHAFLFIGIGALVFPKMYYLMPLFLFFMVVQLRAFTLRAFIAALMGAAFPVLMLEAYLLLTDGDTTLPALWQALAIEALPDYKVLNEAQIVSAAVVMLLSAIAMAHFWRTKFNDRIRTRMLYYIIMIVEMALMALLAFFPQDYDVVMRMLVVNSSPLIAHYFAFARGKVADVFFFMGMILIFLLAAYNFTGFNLGLWRV